MFRTRLGWTVIELLIVIAITALLISIIMPAIAGVQKHARESISSTHLRTHAQVFAVYTGDFNDYFPFLTQASEETTYYEVGGYSMDMSVFTQYATWPIAMLNDYYGGHFNWEIFHPPLSDRGGPISEYWYSQSFVADPTFWNREQRAYSPEQLGGAGVHGVLFASMKGLFIQADQMFTFHETRVGHLNVALVDGSVHSPDGDELTQPYPGGVRGYLLGPTIGFPVMHTVDGIRGRDMAR